MVDRNRFILGKGLRQGFDFVEASAAPRFLRGGACRRNACGRLLGRNERRQSRGEHDRDEEEEGTTDHLVGVYVRPLDVEHIAPGFSRGITARDRQIPRLKAGAIRWDEVARSKQKVAT